MCNFSLLPKVNSRHLLLPLLLLAAGRRLGFGTLTELAVLAGVARPDLEEVFLGLTE